MKIESSKVVVALSISFCTLAHNAFAQEMPAQILGYPTTRSPEGIVWGAQTNGLSGGLYVRRGRVYDKVELYLKSEPANLVGTDLAIPTVSTVQSPHDSMEFVTPTNWFCGPVELINEKGEKVPPLRQELVSSATYPDRFNYEEVFKLEIMRPAVSHIIPAMRIDFKKERPTLFLTFYLTNVFQLMEAGRYQITVHPKIYQRSKSDPEIYERVDLSPVTCPIDFNTNANRGKEINSLPSR